MKLQISLSSKDVLREVIERALGKEFNDAKATHKGNFTTYIMVVPSSSPSVLDRTSSRLKRALGDLVETTKNEKTGVVTFRLADNTVGIRYVPDAKGLLVTYHKSEP